MLQLADTFSFATFQNFAPGVRGASEPSTQLFASAFIPSEAQLTQMRTRPWNGVQFSDEFLSSVQGMGRASGKAVAVFREGGVEPIIESKVRGDEDLAKLKALLAGSPGKLASLLGAEPGAMEDDEEKVFPAAASAGRRGKGENAAAAAAGAASRRGTWQAKNGYVDQGLEPQCVAAPVRRWGRGQRVCVS
eukprot:TRINITY_DN23792_c0_g1_i2.p1 TRINITY_DN23792_c0_g1~~TRINITY_DN23792_c0_g1_i2.p1  ORF type:complete len:191 (+),score=53.25 TRINITY_DN23792_c0_g1_i2:133-705(+)